MDKKVIHILIGTDTARKRFTDFFEQSVFLMKNDVLRTANRANLTLVTDSFSIRFIPNTNIKRLTGITCNWAYGFDPDTTRYLEHQTPDKIIELKPLVENVEELFRRIVKLEGKFIFKEDGANGN